MNDWNNTLMQFYLVFKDKSQYYNTISKLIINIRLIKLKFQKPLQKLSELMNGDAIGPITEAIQAKLSI